MCTSGKWIINKYTGHELFVSCGICPACLQKKAMRRARYIRNSQKDGYLFLFVTLTYDNSFVPYIRKSDIVNAKKYPVYKVSDDGIEYFSHYQKDVPILRRDYVSLKHGFHEKNLSYNDRFEIVTGVTSISLVDFDLDKVKSNLNGFDDNDCIGVCYYKDLQDFIKRLRINLKRSFGYEDNFKFFSTSEYGSKSARPHFHLLIRVPVGLQSKFRLAVAKSWQFSSRYRLFKGIEIARDAATYVSTYVNSSNCSSPFLFQKGLRPKSSFSKNFGMDVPSFSLSSISKKVSLGALEYNVCQTKDGVPLVRSIPLPNYVISRHFPKFVGSFRLNEDEVRFYISEPKNFLRFYDRLGMDYDTAKKTYIRFVHKIENYKRCFPYSNPYIDYADLYVRARALYASTVLKHSYDGVNSSALLLEQFDNIQDYFSGDIDCPSLDVHFAKVQRVEVDPNKFLRNQFETNLYTSYYEKYDKYKKYNESIQNHV